MLSELRRGWWLMAARGATAVLFGLFVFFWPRGTIVALVWVLALFALLSGLFTLLAGVLSARHMQGWWVLLLEGLAAIAFAVFAFMRPAATVVALVWLVAVWAIVTGAFGIIVALQMRRVIAGESGYLAGAVLAVLLGVALLAFPAAAAVAGIWVLGAYAVGYGAMQLTFALRFRKWLDGIEGLPQPR
jgi:uncharacterized membrane protein HdeD (DUF308 family)